MVKCTEKPDGTECFLSVGQMKERYQTLKCITNLGKGMGREKKEEEGKERTSGAMELVMIMLL